MDKAKEKPSLAPAATGATDGGKRILASLEQGGRTPPKASRSLRWEIDGWSVGAGLIVVMLGTFVWLAHENIVTPMPQRLHSSGDTYPAPARTAALPSAHRQPAAVDAAPEQQPARIVNEAVVAPHGAPATATPDSPTVQPVTSAARTTQPRTTQHSATGVPTQQRAAPFPSTHLAGRPAGDVAAAAQAAHRQSIAPAPPTARAQSPAGPQDTDVTLLTALVAHANKPVAVAPERSRDVVDRQQGDATASLLIRCKQLGLIEGMLCRSRICSGPWENDAACRAPSHDDRTPAAAHY